MKRRSDIEIKIDILKSLRGEPKKKTKVMYATNTSWNAFCTKLKELIAAGLVEEKAVSSQGDEVYYSLTTDGLKVIELFDTLVNKMSKEE